MKTLLVDTIITPYIVPRYNALAKKLGGNLTVWFQSFTDVNRKWKVFPEVTFPMEFLKDTPIRLIGKDIFTFHINREYPKKLSEFNPDHIIIVGWDSFVSLYSVIWAKRHKKRLTLWAWSTVYETSWRRTLTLPYVKWLVRNCSDYISYGTRSSEYLIALWAKKDNIQPFYNTVDVSYFTQNAQKYRKEKEIIKKHLWIKTTFVLMFNGQIIERKWVWEMLLGYEQFKKSHGDISLVIVWSGQEEEKLKNTIKDRGIQDVFFTGYVQLDELPKYYAIADIFTLPSREEVWWLVINEAMACGLPILTAYQVGASADLVQEGKNGYIMKENTSEEFARGLFFIFEKNLITTNTSLQIIEEYSIENNMSRFHF